MRLKEYGSELIELADNGSGIRPEDYEAVAAKYHTSKISSFRDVEAVQSFGFRGEALSSLCAVAQLCITTRTADQDVGTRLTFDHHGRLTGMRRSPAPASCAAQALSYCGVIQRMHAGKEPAARSVGTTVSVKELFKTLPVRYKTFQRGVKKEFVKLAQLLQAYALTATGVKMVATNQVRARTARGGHESSAGRRVLEVPCVRSVCGSRTYEALDEMVPTP